MGGTRARGEVVFLRGGVMGDQNQRFDFVAAHLVLESRPISTFS
jgi:hypothetical protein